MTRFTFIHAADLHLGSPLAGLAARNAEVAQRFASAGRRAFEDLVGHAIEAKVAFLIVAGDVYDGDWADHSIGLFFARQVARLDRAGIPVVLVRGNHDAESVITKAITLPEAVRTFSTKKPETLRLDHLKVALHGQSFPNRAVDENLSLAYPAAVPGWFNVGVLHTSCTGHAQHATYAPCSVADLRARGYDYWALGHIHDYTELSQDPWILFPGNLQGRSICECGPKGAVAVDVADGQVTDVRRVIVDHARFHSLSVPIDGAETEAEAVARVEAALRPLAAAADGRLLAVRVHLTGVTAAHDRLGADRETLSAEIQAAADRVGEDLWLEKLKLDTARPSGGPRESVVDAVDPVTLLAEIDRDPEFRARATAALAEIVAKMPTTEEGDLAADLDTLCAEAEAMILGRLTKRAC